MRRSLKIVLASFAGLAAVWLSLPLLPDDADTVSAMLRDRDGQILHVATTEDGYYRLPADLEAIDPAFVEALIAIEDKRFRQHIGVDGKAIVRALKSNASAGRVVSGASTITMQLGRQYTPRPRTYVSKIVEALEAVRLDMRMAKDEQLERYLTRISYGGNIQGVEAASRIWFGKSARYLSTDEIALLLALPQAPEARRPDRNPVAAKAGRDLILDRMVTAGLLQAEDAETAKAQTIGTVRQALPDDHFLALEAIGSGPSLLDAALQSSTSKILQRYVESEPVPVNASALIVHAPSRDVRALIGTGSDRHAGGWIDMTDRLRSPGSTLKPFIYGLARDDGRLDQHTSMRDAPTRFGSYRPENFTRRYHGRVTVAEALQHSLNVPAVAALDAVGATRFRAALAAAGPEARGRIGDMEGEGLALALGGTGLSARDLAVLYTALANGGQAGPLRFKPDDEGGPTYALMSPETAEELIEVLRGSPRPDGYANLKKAGRIAFKTGTSYGFRDSWAAGIAGDYVVIVWIGRPDGAPRSGHTGRGTAAPILFDIAASLTGQGMEARSADPAPGLSHFNDPKGEGPSILFPADGSDVLETDRGISISVESQDAVRLYVNNTPLQTRNALSIWHPAGPGFYRITAVDETGRSTNADVRVLSRDKLIDAPF